MDILNLSVSWAGILPYREFSCTILPGLANLKILEPVAKLRCFEKTMILSQFASRASDQSPAPPHIIKRSRGRVRDGKMTQKGVFAMRWNFATGSLADILK
jgi:hypothetical protein